MSEQNYEDVDKEAGESGEDKGPEGQDGPTNEELAAKEAAHQNQEQAAVDELHDRAVADAEASGHAGDVAEVVEEGEGVEDFMDSSPVQVLRWLANGEITREAARAYLAQSDTTTE